MPTTPATAHPGLSLQQVDAYRHDGYVVVPDLYPPETMLAWKRRLAELVAPEQEALKKGGVRVWMSDQLPPDLLAAMGDERVVPILRQIVGPAVAFLSAKVVFKNGVTRFASPWHQDRFYWHGSEKISVWIALDDATRENGCLMVIPGTHRRLFTEQRVKTDTGFELRIADEDVKDLPVETVPVKRGGAVFFSDLSVHASHPNSTGGDRWALITTYRDAAVPDDSTVWKTSVVVS
jgi:hypothetical protein